MAIPVIAITNQSTVLTDKQVSDVLPALQKQVSSDFCPYWQIDSTLIFLPKGNVLTKGWWQLVIVDNPDQAGALGYHEMTAQGTPLGKVFAKLDIQSGNSWTVTLSHELLEILGDPWIDTCIQGSDNNIYALEVCDAVEADSLGYEIDGVLLSDFVTPSWFEPTALDRKDFKQHTTKQFELAVGGYISIYDQTKGWTQVMAKSTAEVQIPAGSRRDRRTVNKNDWRLSAL
jgi:hypothetical protein